MAISILLLRTKSNIRLAAEQSAASDAGGRGQNPCDHRVSRVAEDSAVGIERR